MIKKPVYGYTIQNGETIINSVQGDVVRKIFAMYKAGNSFSKIAEELTKDGKVNAKGEVKWDKARISRIISNPIYTGDGVFPRIVSDDDFSFCNKQRKAKTVKPAYKQLLVGLKNTPVCGKCSSRLFHMHHEKWTIKDHWKCKSCGTVYHMEDETVIRLTLEILEVLKGNPLILDSHRNEETEDSVTVMKLLNRINTSIVTMPDDVALLKDEIREVMAMRYSDISDNGYYSEKLKRIVSRTEISEETVVEIVNTMEARLVISSNHEIRYVLPNSLMVGKEENDGTESDQYRQENDYSYSCGVKYGTASGASA